VDRGRRTKIRGLCSIRTRVYCSGCNQEITEVNYFSNEAGAWCDTCFETENPRAEVNEDREDR
jgi:hypothetical protein